VPGQEQCAIRAPLRMGDIHSLDVDSLHTARGCVDEQKVSGNDPTIAAHRLDYREMTTRGGACQPAELIARRIDLTALPAGGLDQMQCGAVPESLSGAWRGDRGDRLISAPHRLPDIERGRFHAPHLVRFELVDP